MSAVDELPDAVSSQKDSLRKWREQILNWVLYGCAFFGSFAVIGEAKLRLDDGRVEFAIVYAPHTSPRCLGGLCAPPALPSTSPDPYRSAVRLRGGWLRIGRNRQHRPGLSLRGGPHVDHLLRPPLGRGHTAPVCSDDGRHGCRVHARLAGGAAGPARWSLPLSGSRTPRSSLPWERPRSPRCGF